MRVCVVYDCLFPHTIGGGERWYRSLSARLAAEGHEVTYLTLRQWPRGGAPEAPPGVRVRTAGPRMALYAGARRRIGPPVVFGAGVLWHLLRHGRRYEVVHTAAFPYFSLLAAGLLRRALGYRLVVDWFELWSREYWHGYLGTVGGRIGWAVQRLGVRLGQHAFCFSRLTAGRLREEGVGGPVTVLEGMVDGLPEAESPAPAQPLVLFAGRHIPEKRAPALVAAIAHARERLPGLRAAILGDGPQREEVLARVRAHGLTDAVDVPGFVGARELHSTLRRALCLVLPSRREGYGMVVVEASAAGVPSVVCAAPDNAAVELVEEGVNGFVAADASPEALSAAIERVHAGGEALRASTAAWYARNAHRLSLESSLERVSAAYRGEVAPDAAAQRPRRALQRRGRRTGGRTAPGTGPVGSPPMGTRATQPRGDDVNVRSAPQMREYEAIVQRIAADAPARVLDWGCGLGQVSHLLRRAGLEVTAFDHRGDEAPDAEVTLEHYPDVRAYVSSDPRRLPYADASFPAVLSCGVLEHVLDPDASLDELARVLEPGGTLYVYKLPNRFSYLERIARRAGMYYHGAEPHEVLYTPRTARGLLERHGFRVRELRLANMLPLTLDFPAAQRPGAARAVWRANRALARVPGLNRVATNVELVATAPG